MNSTYIMGVIADDAQRKIKLKWYEFWKRDKAEVFYIEKYDLVLVTAYLSQNIEKIFKKEGVEKAVYTKEVATRNPITDIEFTDGRSLFKKLLPDITKKVIKIAGIDKQNSLLAIIDNQLDGEIETLIEKLYGDFKHIILITDNTVRAKEIAEKALDEYGLTIINSRINSKVNCDIALKIGSGFAKLPKHTILIDASCEHNKTNKNVTINWVDLSKTIDLPFIFDSLEVTECMEKVCGIEFNYKLSEFKFNGKTVSASKLVKKK